MIAARIVSRPSPNCDARPDGARVDMLVMHYTGMKTAEEAMARLCDPVARVSSHYTVDTDGTIYAHVPEEMRAWHAGISWWAGEANVNGSSVGIEIVNPGHEFGYVEFPQVQIAAVIDIACEIMARHRIAPARVVGHSDVAPARKEDPGELFPWAELADFGVGFWPFEKLAPLSLAHQMAAPLWGDRSSRGDATVSLLNEADVQEFVNKLRDFGYGVPPEVDVPLEKVVCAFQRHWRPWKIDGVIDEESAYRLAILLDALS
jgi:N-acetylmuramoyl-L-alanine amidase